MAQRITIQIINKIATCLTELPIVCGNSDYVVDFQFDEEWNNHSLKTARFKVNGAYTDVVFEGDVCKMPIISNAKVCWVGVFAGDLSTTTPAIVHCKTSILDGEDIPAPPRDDVYTQILTLCEDAVETAKSVENRANNGEFDGADGKDGKDGQNGVNGNDGTNGVTFTPHVSADGTLSWENDGGLDNPDPVNIVGNVESIGEIVQTLGYSESAVMSQKAVTDEFADITVTHYGKNIASAFNFTIGLRFTDEGAILSDKNCAISDFFPLTIGETINASYQSDDAGTRSGATIRRVLGYDADKNLIGLLKSTVTGFSINDTNVKYVRIQVSPSNLEANFQIEYGISRTEYEEPTSIKVLSASKNVTNSTDLSLTDTNAVFTATNHSDITLVGDYIFGFSQNDSDSTYGYIRVYKFDTVTKTCAKIKDIKHNFGHCNTVDYCEATDSLIFGNGSGVYGTEGKFYVVPNAKNLVAMSTVTLADFAVEFDGTGLGFGDKWNVCWAHDNGGRNDMALLITNDNRDIRMLQLGKGANQFAHGIFSVGKTDDEFNGTFTVIGHCVLNDGRSGVTNSKNCNQGSDWFGGRLYVGVGHRPMCYWKISPNFQTGIASYEECYMPYYDESGAQITGATEGICVTQRYLFIYNVRSADSEIVVYER